MKEELIKRLMTSLKCGVCGRCYESDDINILGHHQELWFLGVLCPACHTRCLVAAVIREDKVPELVTDLTEVELSRFKDRDVITADEMLDIHNFLKSFNGSASQLFSQR